MLGLYLHIPFCQAICSYCNFNRGLFDADLKARYVQALSREIETSASTEPVDTIFFGGGTPSLLEPADLEHLLLACRNAFPIASEAEVTLETNPETASLDRLSAFRQAGINRISFGVQSFDDQQLRRLGRIHDAARAREAVADARRAGFDNLSLDLMLWLPGQSTSAWMTSVEQALALRPDHLSLYLLELYPNAPLRDTMARAALPGGDAVGQWQQTSDDDAADMYLMGLEALDAAGYRQYEISNVALEGRESRHNLKYWTSGAWLGLGCGAHSTIGTRRWQNLASTDQYVNCIEGGRPVRIGEHELTAEARREEALFTGLRLSAGIDRELFAARFGLDPWEVYGGRLSEAVEAGYVWQQGTRFGLTRPGMLVANEILAVFV
jgi:oxygen-independent coproporphyrinogen-3 oxidase